MRYILKAFAVFTLLCAVASCGQKSSDNVTDEKVIEDSITVAPAVQPDTLPVIKPDTMVTPVPVPKPKPRRSDTEDTAGENKQDSGRIIGRDSAIVVPRGGRRTI